MGFYRIVAGLAAAAMLATSVISAAQPARADTRAASTCSGTLIRHQAITSGTTTYGYLDIYYNSATGNNCARTNAAGSYRGVLKHMEVALRVCAETTNTGYCTNLPGAQYFDSDGNDYYYYAGPVTVYGQDHCISWRAGIYRSGVSGIGHCG